MRKLLVAVLLFCATLFAQQLVDISGTVTDQTQAIVAGAKVTLLDSHGDRIASVRSGESGQFLIPQVRSGEYTLVVEIKGFAAQKQRILVAEGKPISASVELKAEGATEVVTVVANATYSESQAMTATKTDTPLRDIPQAIEVINRELINAQAATSMQDAVRNVAGVSVHLGEGRRDQVMIRGFSALSDYYVNGVRDDAPYYRDLSTLERIEVLKGPAAVLYGRGSSGGIINRVEKTPATEAPFGGEIATTFGSYGEKRVNSDFSSAMFGGKLAFRLPGAWEDQGSHRHDFFLKRYTVAPSVLWKPGANTQLIGRLDYLNDERLPDRGIPSLNGRPADIHIGTYYGYGPDDFLRNRVLAQSVSFEHRVDGWTLRNNFRHTGYATGFSNTQSNGTTVIGGNTFVRRTQYNGISDQQNYFNQSEAVKKAYFLGMHHTILAGFEYGFQNKDNLRFDGTAANVALINPVLTRPNYNTTTPTNNNFFEGRTAGIYFQNQIDIARKWKATLGVRFDDYRQSLDDRRAANVDLARVDQKWSPRVGLVYQPTNWASIYGSYSNSFQPSGEGLSLAVNNEQLKPETTQNYEGGVKFDFFGGRMSSTLSAFRLERNNIKTTDPNDTTKLILAGQQRTNGIELSFNGRMARNLEFYGGYAWLDTKILKSNSLSGGVPIQGKRAGQIPLHSANLWATYRFENGFGFGGGVIYNDDRFISNDNLVMLPNYTRVDGTVFWRKQRYDVAINVRNVGNIKYFESAHSNTQIYPGMPVSAFVTTRLRW